VLRFIVQAIQAHVKPTDIVGRWGGEEFGVVLPEATTDQAREVAERIRQTLLHLPLVNRDLQPVPKPTVSQGIATLPDHATDASELIDLADRTLYEAKALGRDMVIVAPPRA
jgi:diguanylate cyclase (GGDEF)-like protein